MAAHNDSLYDQMMQEVVQRTETSRLFPRPSRTSFGQSSRRHSARIEKPNAQPSPRTPERRRYTKGSRYYSSLEEHYRRMMGIEDDDQSHLTGDNIHFSTRPVSWHPSSSTAQQSAFSLDSAYHIEISPTFRYASYQNSPSYHQYQMATSEPTWSQYMHGEVMATSISSNYATVSTSSWPHNNHASSSSVMPYGSSEANGLVSAEPCQRATREQSVELIGLGLYDQPGTTEKIGSKLEEECDVPEAMEAADPDDESSDDEEELPKPEDSKIAQPSLPLLNLSGHSFFFDDDESTKNAWWSQQQAQPEPQIRTSNPLSWV